MTDQESAQQALTFLYRLEGKILLEMWTTLMLTGGVACVFVALILDMFKLKRCAWIFTGVFGYAMTWVPAQLPYFIGFGVIFLSLSNIVKETLAARAPIPANPPKK